MAPAQLTTISRRQTRASQQNEHPSPNDYTVGWICAIWTELRAARAMLDEEHPPLRSKPKHDGNTYSLGRIGGHYIAIACLPEYGTSKAAIVAKSMQSTFPNVRFGVLVGIGGGVPSSENDIRLGDIVVSLPTEQGGGVIQYDLGRREADGFRRVGSLNKPPTLLRTAINSLRAKENVSQEISDMVNQTPWGNDDNGEQYTYPTTIKDVLYRESYKLHVESLKYPVFRRVFFLLASIWLLPLLIYSVLKSIFISGLVAGLCYYTTLTIVDAKQIVRNPRPTRNPKVHYGNIGSGDSVVKNGFERDFLAKRDNVICFEMEAAGLMDDFPCLVIRGISDYADSRKNWEWQPYAAAVAAAFAKRFLSEVTPEQVKHLEPIVILSEICNNLTRQKQEQDHQDITDWLTPVDYACQHSDFLDRREDGTGEWLLESNEFHQWLEPSSKHHTLFCPGMPGAGKTIIASIVIHHLHTTFPEPNIGIAYVYCNFRQQETQRSADLVASLLKQLVQQQPSLPPIVEALYRSHRPKRTRASPKEIMKTLHSVIESFSRTFIIIDALDECQALNERKVLLSQMFSLQDQNQLKLFVTSRFISDIRQEFERRTETISLEIRATDEDIKKYLDAHISRLPLFPLSSDLNGEIKASIIRHSQGIFLLATLYLDSLEDKINLAQVKFALKTLPKGSDTYGMVYTEAMERILGQRKGFRDLAIQALSWITCSKRDLTTTELQHALAIGQNTAALDKNNITDIHLIASVCAGLVAIDEKSDVIRLVHHTAQEYFEQTCSWFPDAQSNIARGCVTYLLFDAFESGFCETDEKLELRLKENVLYEYASRNWGHHAGMSLNRDKDEKALILNFLESPKKLLACSQAMMASGDYQNYSQEAPRQMTGLHLAAFLGLQDYVAILLEKHDSGSRDANLQTALHWAALSGRERVVRLLLENGADLESQDKDNRTALHRGAENGHMAVVELLLEQNAQKESKDIDNRTPLHLAAEKGSEAVACLLLDKGATLDSKDKGGQTPLHRAAGEGSEALVELLLQKGADLKMKDVYDRTPLHCASESGHAAIVELLLKRGANKEAEDKAKWRPLHWAADKGYLPVVKLLLEQGADRECKDEDGRTPLYWADQSMRQDVVRFLRESPSTQPVGN